MKEIGLGKAQRKEDSRIGTVESNQGGLVDSVETLYGNLWARRNQQEHMLFVHKPQSKRGVLVARNCWSEGMASNRRCSCLVGLHSPIDKRLGNKI